MALYASIGLWAYETAWFRKHSDPPAITDVGRGSKLSSNVYVASITMMSTLIPFVSYFVHASAWAQWLSVGGAAALQCAIVLEGDAHGRAHSNFLLVAGLCLGAWFWQLYAEGLLSPTSAPYFYMIGAMFFGLYSIRQSAKLRTLFVLGEYGLILLFILALRTLHCSA